jgi:hypothetical protein
VADLAQPLAQSLTMPIAIALAGPRLPPAGGGAGDLSIPDGFAAVCDSSGAYVTTTGGDYVIVETP